MKTQKTYLTNYSVAVHWCNNSLILCNEIPTIEPASFDNSQFGCVYYTDEDGNEDENEATTKEKESLTSTAARFSSII